MSQTEWWTGIWSGGHAASAIAGRRWTRSQPPRAGVAVPHADAFRRRSDQVDDRQCAGSHRACRSRCGAVAQARPLGYAAGLHPSANRLPNPSQLRLPHSQEQGSFRNLMSSSITATAADPGRDNSGGTAQAAVAHSKRWESVNFSISSMGFTLRGGHAGQRGAPTRLKRQIVSLGERAKRINRVAKARVRDRD